MISSLSSTSRQIPIVFWVPVTERRAEMWEEEEEREKSDFYGENDFKD